MRNLILGAAAAMLMLPAIASADHRHRGSSFDISIGLGGYSNYGSYGGYSGSYFSSRYYAGPRFDSHCYDRPVYRAQPRYYTPRYDAPRYYSVPRYDAPRYYEPARSSHRDYDYRNSSYGARSQSGYTAGRGYQRYGGPNSGPRYYQSR